MGRFPARRVRVRDGKVVAELEGVFGPKSKVNLSLRRGDLRKSAPHGASNPRAAAAGILRRREVEYGGIKSGRSRTDELERRRMRRLGKMKLEVKVDFEKGRDNGDVFDYLFGITLSTEEKGEAKKEKWVEAVRDADFEGGNLKLSVKDIFTKAKHYGFKADDPGPIYRWVYDQLNGMPGKNRIKGVQFGDQTV